MDDWKWRQHLDPEDMTPEERWRRFVELVAKAVSKIAARKGAGGTEPKPDAPQKPRKQ